MKRPNITPGNWQVEEQPDIDVNGNGFRWAIKPGDAEASYRQNPAYCNSEANASLIAAAPKMAEALELIANGTMPIAGGATPLEDAQKLAKQALLAAGYTEEEA